MIQTQERNTQVGTQIDPQFMLLTPQALDFLVPGQIVNVRNPASDEVVQMRVARYPNHQRRFQCSKPRFSFTEVTTVVGTRVRRIAGPVGLGCIPGYGDSVLLQNVLADALASGDYSFV